MPLAPPLPPGLSLHALRAVEAAARAGGFAAAASELGVTPAAVAAQVKALETRTGVPLFARGPRGVAPTAACARLLPALTEAMAHLAEAAAILREEAAPPLRVAALPALAQLVLAPRLPDLAAQGLPVSLHAMEAPPEAKRDRFDVALFYGPDGRDALVPVAAPGVAGPRLADATWSADWALWARATGRPVPPPGPEHSLYALAHRAAIDGGGVLMGRVALVAADLRAGRLVACGPRADLPEGPVARALHGGARARRLADALARILSEAA
ncbi:LysR family transcriptional regulator [Jannaschia sp. Os4]|uniref:LysR family transcriptional regulator n=1 Tax=Jannaschia sp. Os4 TaxID=2807617 RepID=UPI001939F487|nr:LysR family transcriptional regulator [Jannaschia sp. Os4]MBM2578119.1 LysR family transcriptional regulator [Jannaschia sp. Os4]